jgi:hypothetical protein
LVVLVACLGGIACRKAEESKPAVEWVLQVGTQKVSTVTFETEWRQRQSQQERPVPAGDVLGAFVSDWQAYLAAGSLGIMDDPEVQRAIRRVVATKVREHLSVKLAKPGSESPIEPQEIEAVYKSQAQRWQRPAAWNIAWLVASVSPKAEPDRRAVVKERLEGYRRAILASADPKATFAILCSNHSDDTATRYLRGELGWLSKEQIQGRMGRELADQAFLLTSTNQISAVLESPTRMVLLLHLGHRSAQMRPLDEVAPQIRSEIGKFRDAELKAALARELDRLIPAETNHAVLRSLVAPEVPRTTPNAPSPMPKP